MVASTNAPLTLDIIIIGCGLGGLAAAHALGQAGHRVTIVESAPAIGEVGAGIQVTPNVSRLLIRWGVGGQLKKVAVKPQAIAFRRYNTGELVGWTKWGEVMDNDHGSPYYHIHRADFHRLLYDLAEPFATIRLNSTVAAVNPSAPRPSVTLTTGETISADLIVGADGVKSMVREIVLGEPTAATATGDAAYRAIIPTEKMLADPELRPFVENPEMTAWMGPGRHIMAYCIRAKREYNLVLIHPDDGSVESWTAEGSAEKMRADFAGWEPRVEKLLSMVPSTLKWKLMDRQPIPTWIHREGRVVLLGDSCHPMLPYRAQGAAMAIEDAVVLGNILSRLTHQSELLPMLRGYEVLRHTRTALTQASSRLNQHIFHLPDGSAQEERDASMRAAMAAECSKWGITSREGYNDKMMQSPMGEFNGEGNSNQWADPRKNSEQFGYDADAEAERWWDNAYPVSAFHSVFAK
ncbi:FAD/NAD-binding domain-containing protein [Fomitiporia mediterranea MF3/22]|uniref:FAD/NAD-binding domain-containing protein n=1 Tax=Fomitiporia mediterranea (strain MF3/22) TaxID=694068 RepID=UPI0004409281|nr:FAD/NAD-binding domain-containing protein [Fomitiporia mediterranea MF3/22]EJD02574.1 FAD/NAD-binding domain-containing protein [Fomitiporia mediterranea MF3/22]